MANRKSKEQEASVNDLITALSGDGQRRAPIPLQPRTDAVHWTGATDGATQDTPAASEDDFRRACAKLRAERPKPSTLTLALLSVIAVLLMIRANTSLVSVLLLGLVLLFHETGHLLAMRFFGYSNVRVFFLPFFGAATIGQKEGVSAWQQATVSLLGPLPGLVVGIALAALPVTREEPLLRTTAFMLIALNGFNLLPIEPLDGGRVLTSLVFSRNYLLEGYFIIAAVLGLVWLGLMFDQTILYVIAGFLFLTAPARVALAKRAAEFRRRGGEMPASLTAAPEAYLRELFLEARRHRGPSVPADMLAGTMRAVHERAVMRPAGGSATTVLLTIYVMACAAVLLLTTLSARH